MFLSPPRSLQRTAHIGQRTRSSFLLEFPYRRRKTPRLLASDDPQPVDERTGGGKAQLRRDLLFGLTKLYIHRHFRSLLEAEITRASRYNHVMSLLMMDIDSFKQVNDTYGHLVGDRVLKEIAVTIKNTVRNIDVPARYGGEEFTVILPETAAKDATVIAERLRKNIAALEIPLDDKLVLRTSISIGISEYPSSATDSEELIKTADQALYKAKNDGKNCIYVHHSGGFYKCLKSN